MKKNHVQHLYSRAGFGIGLNDLNGFVNKSKNEIVNNLILESKDVDKLEIDLSELQSMVSAYRSEQMGKMNRQMFRDFQKQSREKVKDYNYAWIQRMKTSESVLNEKMTLFWSNVFVCRDNNVVFMQQYNNTLRRNALGNFRDFVKEISKEPSMSKYLNNRQNVKESPNENFARELMELFTLGIGNYSEADIQEAARAFTGWSFRRNGDFFLRQKQHDNGKKHFMGKSGYFGGDDIIDIIIDQKQCSKFICEKIYRYFVNPEINNDHLDEISTVFYRDYDIENLMKYIFNSEWFYDQANIGVKIKSPIELLVGIQKIVPVDFEKKNQQLYLQKMMGQTLLYPPNVAGWQGDKNWIDSNTLMFRMKLASLLLSNASINVDEKGEFEDSFENYYKNQDNRKRFLKVTKSWEDFDKEYKDTSSEELKELLILSKIDEDTDAFLSKLKIRDNRSFLVQLMSIPEYQLC